MFVSFDTRLNGRLESERETIEKVPSDGLPVDQ